MSFEYLRLYLWILDYLRETCQVSQIHRFSSSSTRAFKPSESLACAPSHFYRETSRLMAGFHYASALYVMGRIIHAQPHGIIASFIPKRLSIMLLRLRYCLHHQVTRWLTAFSGGGKADMSRMRSRCDEYTTTYLIFSTSILVESPLCLFEIIPGTLKSIP